MPTFVHGSSLYLAIGTAGGETDISSYVKDVKWPDAFDKHDVTTGGSTAHQEQPGLENSNVTISGIWNATIDGIMNALLSVTGKSIVYGPAGNTSGKVKVTSLGWLSKYERDTSVTDYNAWTAEFTPTPTTTVKAGVTTF